MPTKRSSDIIQAPPTDDDSAPPSLLIDDRAGTVRQVQPGQTFTIGRAGHLAFPDNPYLHGRIIAVAFQAGLWWISNIGGRIPVKLIDPAGAQTVLRSGTSTVIVSDLLLVFEAGPTTYEVALRSTTPLSPPSVTSAAAPGTELLTAGNHELGYDQYRLLTAMAEPLLRYPGTGLDRIPTIPAVAERLGWSVTKTNRGLDRLCEHLADQGVSGLVSDGRGAVVNRRTRLVEYALDAQLVTVEALTLLDEQ